MRAIFNVGENKAQSILTSLLKGDLTRHVNALHLTTAPWLPAACFRCVIYVASDRKFYRTSLFLRFYVKIFNEVAHGLSQHPSGSY